MNRFPFEPTVRVGLCEDAPFRLDPHGVYDVDASEEALTYTPRSPQCAMGVHGLKIGRGFHWQQARDMRFAGTIQLRRDENRSLLLNFIKAEEYLASVVGSEMNPLANAEYIKAHAIISRSWLLRMLSGMKKTEQKQNTSPFIIWTQADAHHGYDVCPDDHCQRYQGLDAVTPASRAAVQATRGLALTDADGNIVDARFSKCCGGKTEIFSTCWDDEDYPYLVSKTDPYCAQIGSTDLSSYLKDYDRMTVNPYEWEESVSAELIQTNFKRDFGIDTGKIKALIPIKRGPSGRIRELKIVGENGEYVVGKELTIRRLLSETHLYSSAFDVVGLCEGKFRLKGRGWGHGVGLCQIGAAVMAAHGATAREILEFYYPNTTITEIYG